MQKKISLAGKSLVELPLKVTLQEINLILS